MATELHQQQQPHVLASLELTPEMAVKLEHTQQKQNVDNTLESFETVASITQNLDIPFGLALRVLQDYYGVSEWNPFVSRSGPVGVGPKTVGIGAERFCAFGRKLIKESVLGWFFDLEMGDGILLIMATKTLPGFRSLVAMQRVSRSDDGTTQFTMSMGYVLKFGRVGKLMAQTIVKRKLEATCHLVAQGLQHYAQTGEKLVLNH